MHIRHLTLVPLAIAIGMAVPAPAQTPGWTLRTPTLKPAARQNSAMVYDTVRGVSVLFGGWDGTQRRSDTWEWNGAVWNQIITPNTPSPRDAMAMAYDSLRQVTVCTGGYVSPDQTWEYDGADWTQINPATTHSLAAHCPMVFDISRGVCVLFGTSSTTGLLETWEWNGADWTQIISANAPGDSGNMAYDSVRMRTVHFGIGGDTWEYDGASWLQMSPANSPPGTGCGSENMVYDLGRGRVVLFGGCKNPDLGETWEYDSVDWQENVTANMPSFPRRYPAMAYDSIRQRTVLFGGRDFSTGTATLADDTWEYYDPNLEPGTRYCPGDGVVPHTFCPCANNNNGDLGGCDWGDPAFPGGGLLSANGGSDSMAANDTLLVATGVSNNFGIFFGAANQVNGGNGNPLNDGLRCAGGSLVRLIPPTMASGNQLTLPVPVQTLDTGAAAGVTRRYQYWFRTPNGPCGQQANLTNGYEVVWMP